MANPTNSSEPPNASAQMNSKRRRKKSIVWDHFTIETINAECTKARCMQCKKAFSYITGSKLAGTSHLKRHIALGICPVNRSDHKDGQLLSLTPLCINQSQQQVNDLSRKRHKSISNTVSFYQNRCINDMAKMIIMHEYPLTIVECPAFLNSIKALQPQFPNIPLDGIEKECFEVYKREKQTLSNLVNSVNGRVNLSLDMWSTDQSVGYAFVTGQFIDDDWKLHRRILGIVLLPFPESESAFNHAILSCVSDWNLENKLFAVTLDESFANKAVRTNMIRLLSDKNPLILNGKLLIGKCYARVLGLLAQDSLGALSEIIKKVRDSVKYVITINGIQERFNDLKLQLQVPTTKTLILDDQNQWNTTYYMLIAACELKEVFSCLDAYDPNYQTTLTMDNWKQLETLCTFLKLLVDAASLLTGPTYPTSNAFFHEAWKLQLELKNATYSDDLFLRSLIKPMYEQFNKYWEDSYLVFSIAVVMDPRFKMKLVEFSFPRIYGEIDAVKPIKNVFDGVNELFFDYMVQMLPPPTFVVNGNNEYELKTEVNESEIFLSDDFDVYVSTGMAIQGNVKRELEMYLEESVLPRMQEFDVLGWWKLNRKKYPTLSKMAADVLCIPVSTVGKESVFDVRSRKMDRYRCGLRAKTVEALICAKDWLRYGSPECSPEMSPEYSPRSVVKMEL